VVGRIIGGVFKRLGDLSLQDQGHVVRDEVAWWSHEVGALASAAIQDESADLLITSLFGAGAADVAGTRTGVPWAMVNSTFYVGPNPPRPLSADFGPRAVPIIEYFQPIVDRASLVLHATDQVFDFEHERLTDNHRYVGPLIWEPETSVPAYLNEPGDPWVLVTLSSQLEDDLPLARAALDGLADRPVRVLITTGGAHPTDSVAPLAANARAEEYVSHSVALDLSRVMVSHSGHGSVMKALWHGVPMVLVPWGRDQPGVAARAEKLRVAKVLPRDALSAEALAGFVQDVMVDHEYRDAARRQSQRLRQSNPIAAAVAALETL
jgi:UDP:flavonoid glycosyltransferase YjiC (YdhE family)